MPETDEVLEVVDAELVDDDHLPAIAQPIAPAKPLIDQHTILRPGQAIPTTADQPTYTRTDFEVSDRTARRMDEESAPKNTDKNYRSQRGLFETWCQQQGRVPRPCTTATFVEYVSHLIDQDRAPSTISVAMSAVRTWMPDDAKPGTSKARGMLNEHAKTWAKRKRRKKAPAIREDTLRKLLQTCDPQHPTGIRDACVLVLGWGALNRRIELADLTIQDVTVEDDGVSLYIASAKNDQAAKGRTTFIPARPDDPLADPVTRARAWLNMLYRLDVRDGALFRALTVAGTLQSRTTATERGDHVSGDAINGWIRGRACKAGLANWESITAHGLRRGGAQEISEAGGDPTDQGRWVPGSPVVKREYIDWATAKNKNPWLAVERKKKEAAE